MTAPEPLLRVSGLQKTWGSRQQALGGISLEVRQKDFVTLLGPSGCGKSTLLRIIAGLEKQSAGGIDWFVKPRTSFVFQEPNLIPWRTTSDNVALPLELAGQNHSPDRDTKVQNALDLVGLGASGRLYPHQLSGGMKMRASVARALVTQPELLLMDEPFAALDEPTRFELQEELLHLASRAGTTIVFVTHSIAEATFLSNRVVILSKRPARVLAEIDINIPSPRTFATRVSAAYAAVMAQIHRLSHDESELSQAVNRP